MPAFLIFKEPSARIPPKAFAALQIPQNIRVTASPNGWMTSDKMQEWFRKVCGENEDDVRRLLVLDLAPVHKTAASLAAIAKRDSDLVTVPAGCTAFLQPADVSWNKPFKDSLRKSWAVFMNKRQKTPKGNLKKPSRQDMVNFVSEAWSSVSDEIIERSFKACGISAALDGTENGFLNSRLAEVSAVCSEALQQDAADLMFASDSEESFDGFSDNE